MPRQFGEGDGEPANAARDIQHAIGFQRGDRISKKGVEEEAPRTTRGQFCVRLRLLRELIEDLFILSVMLGDSRLSDYTSRFRIDRRIPPARLLFWAGLPLSAHRAGFKGKLKANTAGNPQGDHWLTCARQDHIIERLDALETVLDRREPIRPGRVRNDERLAAHETVFVVEIGERARIARHAQYQEFTAERVVNLARIDPTRRRDNGAGCEEPPGGERRLKTAPVEHIERRVFV